MHQRSAPSAANLNKHFLWLAGGLRYNDFQMSCPKRRGAGTLKRHLSSGPISPCDALCICSCDENLRRAEWKLVVGANVGIRAIVRRELIVRSVYR